MRFRARCHRFGINEMRIRKERLGFSVENVSVLIGQRACIHCISAQLLYNIVSAHILDEKLVTAPRIVSALRIETVAQWS